MHISLMFWEWGCPQRGDAHITVTPGLSHFLRKAFLAKNMQLELTKYIEPLLQDTEMITQSVPPSSR